jgi:hypothetical protein
VCQAGVWSTGCSRVSTAAYGYKSPDCPVSRLRRSHRSREPSQQRMTIIHRTVQCVTGLSGEHTVGHANGRPRNSRVTRGRANGRMGAPDCPVCTGQCPVRQRLQILNGRLRQNRKEICTGQCPMRQSTEGKNCLPGLLSTAPSCLGAIKGTPRRMKEYTKHTLSILDHSHSVFAHSFDILSDLSSVLVRTL